MSEIANRAEEKFGVYPAPNTVHLERILPGPIERVWAYLTEPEKRAKWFAGGPMPATVGSAGELLFDNSNLGSGDEAPEQFKKYERHTMKSTVTRYEPPHAFGFTFGDGTSEVLFELSERDGEVVLVVKHWRLSSREGLLGVSSGWHAHLGVLLDVLTEAPPRPFWARYVKLKQEYEKRVPA